jgi:hypothetical protein
MHAYEVCHTYVPPTLSYVEQSLHHVKPHLQTEVLRGKLTNSLPGQVLHPGTNVCPTARVPEQKQSGF